MTRESNTGSFPKRRSSGEKRRTSCRRRRGPARAPRQGLERRARRLGRRRRGPGLSVSSSSDGGGQSAHRSRDSKRVRRGADPRHPGRTEIRHGGVTAQILDRTYIVPHRRPGRRPSDLRCDRLDARSGTVEHAREPAHLSSQHYSTALLEKLVHGSGRLPPNQHYVEITIPRGLSYEVFSPPSLPGWDSPPTASRGFGEQWRHERRSPSSSRPASSPDWTTTS